MAAQQQQGGGGGSDNSLAPLWITILLFITAFLVWHFAHAYIVMAYFQMKYFEAYLVSLFSNQLLDTINFIRITPPASVNFETMIEVGDTVGHITRYPIGILMIILSIILYLSDVTQKYRVSYDMSRLADEEVSNWPQIAPVLKLNLIEKDLEKGGWSMALTPMMFAKKYDILQEDKPKIEAGIIIGSAESKVKVIPSKATLAFNSQMGRYWESVEKLTKPQQALMAVFSARLNGDRDGAHNLLLYITRSCLKGKVNFSQVLPLLKKHFNTKPVQTIIAKHAYVYTILASMLEKSRLDGVLATADFLWLKPMNRRLWYMLNSIGRQTPFVEAAATYAHWLAEKELGRRIMVPMIGEAVKALELAIDEIKYNPDIEQ